MTHSDLLQQTAPAAPASARAGADVERLLGTPAHAVLARRIGQAALHADLLACLDRLAEVVHAHPTVIPPELTGVFTGGKRLRPLLVFAAAYAVGPLPASARERAVACATAVELLHLASLVHDDIMDEADLRHGTETINSRAGTGRALVAGDLLLGHAHAAAAAAGAEGARLIGTTLVRLCDGQAEEFVARFDAGRTERSYFASIEGKTGSLVEACCRLGALAAGCDATTTEALGQFGLNLGVAYQLADDLLDFVEVRGVAGKPVGHDLATGTYTYPTLWAMRRDPRLRRILSELDADSAAGVVAEAARRVRDTGALDATRRAIGRARGRCLNALGAAVATLGSEGVDLLAELALTVVPPTDPEVADSVLVDGGATATEVQPKTVTA
jgi:heptaprenyl diphosphate synthase